MRRGRTWIAATGGTLLLLAVAVATPAAEPAALPRNLIVISIDTLRADRLGCYGHTRPTSPALDALAGAGAVFEDASATSPWTKPSHASLLTGLFPGRNGATSMEGLLREDAVHLASWLAGRGFRTAAVVNVSWLKMHGLERGFGYLKWVKYVQGRRESSPVTDEAVRWLEGRDSERPFFLLVHYMDVHSDYASLPRYERPFVRPYDGPADGTTQQLYRVAEGRQTLTARDADHLLDLYDAGIRQVDDEIGRLLAHLRKNGLLKTSLLVVTSDHGEEFLEHGGVSHGQTQYQEVIRIPLIFHGPGVPATSIAAPVCLVDVMPTALVLLGLPVPPGLDGLPLDGLWRGGGSGLPPRSFYFEADVTFPPPGPGFVPPGPHRAIRRGSYKLHYNLASGETRLFDLSADPGETVDVQADHGAVAKRLHDELRRYLEDPSASSAPEPPPGVPAE